LRAGSILLYKVRLFCTNSRRNLRVPVPALESPGGGIRVCIHFVTFLFSLEFSSSYYLILILPFGIS